MTIQWVRKQDTAWQSSMGVTVSGVDKKTISDCPQIQVSSGDGAPSYKSDAASIVTVDSNTGEIKLQGRPGMAKITATLSNGGSDSYTITVQEIEAIISFPNYVSSSASISVNGGLDLNPAAKFKVSQKDVSTGFAYVASNSNVTVSNTGHVTAVSAGTATITVRLNSTQYTAAQATFVVQVQNTTGNVNAVMAVAKVTEANDKVKFTTTSNAIVLTVSGGARPVCQIVPTMTINGVKQADVGVTYEYSITSSTSDVKVNSDGSVEGGSTAGVVEVMITATLKNNSSVTASNLFTVTVIPKNGDDHNPRPTLSYPAYSSSQTPTIKAVKALLKALMASNADTPDNKNTAIDESNIVVAQKLFGFDYDYFNAVATDGSGKKMVFTIKESNDIYQASSTANSHLKLKVTKELVLGDSIAFSFTRGNTFNVNVNLNDKTDRTSGDAVQTGHGVTNTSITGIASELTLDVSEAVVKDDLYQYDPYKNVGDPGTDKNYIYLPRLKTLKLDYGNITSYRADRVITIEFMGAENKSTRLDANRCSYASFQLVTKNLFHSETQSNGMAGTLFSPNIGSQASGVSLVDPGTVIAPDEKNLSLPELKNYFQGLGAGDGYMAQYDRIALPIEFLADSAIDNPGVNILQFTKGKNRLVYEYLDGMIKQYWLANKLVATTIVAAVRVAVAMVFIHKLDYFQVNYNNHNNAAFTMNMRLQPLEANMNVRLMNSVFDVTVFNNEDYFGAVLEKFWGPTAVINDAISVKVRAVKMAERIVENEAYVTELNNDLLKLREAKALADEKKALENKVAMVTAEFCRVASLKMGFEITS